MKKFISYLSTYVEDALVLSFVFNMVFGGVFLCVNSYVCELVLNVCLVVLAVCSFVVAFISGAALIGKIKEEEEEA